MKRSLLLTVAAAALATGSIASAQPRPPGSGVGTAQNRNGQPPPNINDVLAQDLANNYLNQDQVNRLQSSANQVRETLDRQTTEAGRRFAGTNQANVLAIQQGARDALGQGSGSQAYSAVDFTSTALGRRAAFTNEVGVISQDFMRGANAVVQERARMIAENPNVPEAVRRQVQREAEESNRSIDRARAYWDGQEAGYREVRARIDANRDYLAGRAQDMIDRYGPDPRNWPQPPTDPRQPGATPPAPPAPPPPWSVGQPPSPSPPAPLRPSGPPRRGTIPTTAEQDPAFRARTRPPTEAEQQARRRAAAEAAQRAAAQQEAQRRAAEEAARRNRPPPPPPPPPPPSWPPPLNRPPSVLAPVYGPPVPNSRTPRARPANPNELGLPGSGGSGRGGGGGGGGSQRGPFEFRPIPGNAFVPGEFDWLGDAAGGSSGSLADSFAWAARVARAADRPPGRSINEPWRGFERGLPMTVVEFEAIYENWDINTAPPGSSGRSFSSAGNSPRMDWFLSATGPLSTELAWYQASGLLFRSASEGGPRMEWGPLGLTGGRPSPRLCGR